MTTILRPSPVEMVIDSSALIAIIRDEPTSPALIAAIGRPGRAVISAANLLEATMVAVSRSGPKGHRALHTLITAADIVVMPVDDVQLTGAIDAWQRFGRGQHRAQLNFGDCFAYALARQVESPLLCIGTDFAQTDLPLVEL